MQGRWRLEGAGRALRAAEQLLHAADARLWSLLLFSCSSAPLGAGARGKDLHV